MGLLRSAFAGYAVILVHRCTNYFKISAALQSRGVPDSTVIIVQSGKGVKPFILKKTLHVTSTAY